MTNNKEKGHALNMIKAALMNAQHIPIAAKLEGLGTLANQSTLVDHTSRDFLQYFESNLFNLASASHTLLGFLDNTGARMANATTAADPLILKPVQNGVIANCRPPNVSLAQFRYVCNFCDCIDPNLLTNTPGERVSVDFVVALPQTTVSVNDGNNQPRQLTTFHGANDVRLSLADNQAQILHHTLQTGLATTGPPTHNSTNCTLVTEPIRSNIRNQILELCFPTAVAAVSVRY